MCISKIRYISSWKRRLMEDIRLCRLWSMVSHPKTRQIWGGMMTSNTYRGYKDKHQPVIVATPCHKQGLRVGAKCIACKFGKDFPSECRFSFFTRIVLKDTDTLCTCQLLWDRTYEIQLSEKSATYVGVVHVNIHSQNPKNISWRQDCS